MRKHTEGLIDVARLTLAFARINRVTTHEDGVRLESDTDHTVMLSLCACALADALYKDTLDLGKVAQFAIVHDLVEVYAGDVNTINISKEDRKLKEEREEASLAKITSQFSSIYPWIPETIAAYERRDTKEAVFVKILDKGMAKITNTLNNGVALKKLGTTEEEITRHFTTQLDDYRGKYNQDFKDLLDIIEELMQNMLKELYA
jgi:putative hydrolase of HD superfamily